MKKLFTALFLLLASAAQAQNYLRDDGIFHSVVEGTTNGQCLQNSGGLLVGGACGTPGGSSGQVQYNGGGTFAGNAGFTYVAGGAVTIVPTALSNNQGVIVSQSTPNGGAVAGPIALNHLTCIDGTQTVTGTTDSFGEIANVTSCLSINHNVTGGAANHFGVNVWMNVTGSNGGVVANLGNVFLNGGSTITGPHWAGDFEIVVGSNTAFNGQGVAVLGAITGASTATISNRIAFNAATSGSMPAGSIDAGYLLSVVNNQAAPYNGATSFTNGMYFSSNYSAANQFPVVSTGNMFLADTGTVGSIFNFANVTSTTILSTPNTTLAGNGTAAFGSSLVANKVSSAFPVVVTSPSSGCLQVGANGGTHPALNVDCSTASAVTGAYIFSDIAGNGVQIIATSSATNEDLKLKAQAGGQVRVGFGSTGGVTLAEGGGAITFNGGGAFAGNLTTGKQWYLGTTSAAPQTGPILSVSKNVAAIPAIGTPAGVGGTTQAVLSVAGVDSSGADANIQAFGGIPAVRMFSTGGTAASPASTANNGIIAAFDGYGYSTSSSFGYQAGMGFVGVATQAWGATIGARLDIYATPAGTAIATGPSVVASFGASLMVGTTTDGSAGQIIMNNASFLMRNKTSWTNNAAAQTATLTNGPTAGNPTKWIPIDDNGTTRNIPAW